MLKPPAQLHGDNSMTQGTWDGDWEWRTTSSILAAGPQGLELQIGWEFRWEEGIWICIWWFVGENVILFPHIFFFSIYYAMESTGNDGLRTIPSGLGYMDHYLSIIRAVQNTLRWSPSGSGVTKAFMTLKYHQVLQLSKATRHTLAYSVDATQQRCRSGRNNTVGLLKFSNNTCPLHFDATMDIKAIQNVIQTSSMMIPAEGAYSAHQRGWGWPSTQPGHPRGLHLQEAGTGVKKAWVLTR